MHTIFSAFKNIVSNQNVRHLLMNYSSSSNGARHPEGPVGWILRDEGQVDLYAGRTKLVLGINGELVSIARNVHHIAERTSFTVKGISNFRILGKYFTREIFDGQKVLAIKPKTTISSFSVIGPDTHVKNTDGTIGRIVNAVPLPTIFDERLIFSTDEMDKSLLPPSVSVINVLKTFMR